MLERLRRDDTKADYMDVLFCQGCPPFGLSKQIGGPPPNSDSMDLD